MTTRFTLGNPTLFLIHYEAYYSPKPHSGKVSPTPLLLTANILRRPLGMSRNKNGQKSKRQNQELEGFQSTPNSVSEACPHEHLVILNLKGLIQAIKFCRCCSLLAKDPKVLTESEQKSKSRKDEEFLKG